MTKLLYQDDSYLRETIAIVEDVTNDGITLDRTILYPKGGGQDGDAGEMSMGGRVWRIDEVRKMSGNIVHNVQDPSGLVRGDEVLLRLYWGRRYPMMKFHTALHILSDVAYKDYGAKITGNNITSTKARIDLDLEGLAEDIIRDLEEKTNRTIGSGLPVFVRMTPRKDAEAIVDPGKTRLDMIPESVTDIRLVFIGETDVDACGGTHVRNTSEIGGIEIFNAINKGRNKKRLELRLRG